MCNPCLLHILHFVEVSQDRIKGLSFLYISILNCKLVHQTVQTSYMSFVDFAVGKNTESTSSIHNDDPSKVNNWF